MNKELEIINEVADKIMLENIFAFSEKMNTGVSAIQVENFILNDIEFPTEYGKYKQTQAELVHRLNQVVDIYYESQEKKIKIRQKEKKIQENMDTLECELLELQKEKLAIQLKNANIRLKTIVAEARIFYDIFQEYSEFHNLSSAEQLVQEKIQWAKKTLNMPTVFEERYGAQYMERVLGAENYAKYKESRQRSFGILPREMIESQKPQLKIADITE